MHTCVCVHMNICVSVFKTPSCLRYSLLKRVTFLSKRGQVAPVHWADREGKDDRNKEKCVWEGVNNLRYAVKQERAIQK